MKKMIIVFVVAMGFSAIKADAQYVRVRPGLNIDLSIGNRPPRPYDDAIWIEVPGRWERPRHNSRYRQGRWIYTRRGYRWQQDRWRY